MPTWEWGASHWSSVKPKAKALIEGLVRRRLRGSKVTGVSAHIYEEFDTDYLIITVKVDHASPSVDQRTRRILLRDLKQRLDADHLGMQIAIDIEPTGRAAAVQARTARDDTDDATHCFE